VKEALFSMLVSRFDLTTGALLDLFAGSGALGIEGMSRGAPHAVFVEQDGAARRALEANLQACGFQAAAQIMPVPVQRALRELAARQARFAGVFMDPPYGKGLADAALTQLATSSLVPAGGWVAVEHHADDQLASAYGCLRLTAARRYGKTGLALYSSSQMVEQAAAT
jgi:16S rRNA (guanine(966)-N(2))-methyltransferase RsmD